MKTNARLLAVLASCGIVHLAPIALFHNRIQSDRRRDQGRYEWFRGGRLDRNMVEVLRVADQKQMSLASFRLFLDRRGYPGRDWRKGEADIVIHTGPHLGAFNRPISVPDLIEAVGTVSAFCITGRFWRQKFDESLPAIRQPAGSTVPRRRMHT